MRTKTGWEWGKFISDIKRTTKITLNDKKNARIKVVKALEDAVKKRLPAGKFGILFSGGLDSSVIALICKKLCKNKKNNFTCYSVGLENAEDLLWAKKAAKEMKLNLKTKTIGIAEAESIIKKTAKLLPIVDVVSIGVGSVVYAALEMAKKDRVKMMFSGLGSEEIFAGYERHIGYEKKSFDGKSIEKECWKGLVGLWKRDMIRDLAISNNFKMKIEIPFLDEDVIRTAMQIPSRYKIDSQQKKIILREAAESVGLPEDIAWRKKRAAQYGSRFDKAIEKLARMNGFGLKKEYVESLEGGHG